MTTIAERDVALVDLVDRLLGGGVVIVIVVSAAMVWAAGVGLFRINATALAALVVAAVSAVDDLRPLTSGFRLLLHFGCAVVAVLTIAADGPRDWSAVAMVLGVIWIV